MPDIDTLMQEWPPEFEDLLKEVCIFIFSSPEPLGSLVSL